MDQAALPSRLEIRLVMLTLLLVPLNWVLGTALLWLYPVGLILLVANERLAPAEWILAHLFLALTLGLAVAVLAGAPGDRVAGSIYNLTIIVMMLGFMTIGRRLMAADQEARNGTIYRAAVWVGAVQLAALAAGYLYTRATGATVVEFPTLILGRIGSLPGVLNDYATAKISVADWTSEGETARLVGFGIYVTEGAYLVLVIGLFAALHAALRGRYVLAAAIEGLTAIALLSSASRTTLLAAIVSLGLFAPLIGRSIKVLGLLLLPTLLVGLVVVFAYRQELFVDSFEAVNTARAGSSEERFRSYTMAIDMVMSTNPFTGLGIKPRDEALLSVPIGSHSSFVSMFTKGGAVALGVFLVMWAYVVAQIASVEARLIAAPQVATTSSRVELIYLSRCGLCTVLWWITEDFDAPAHHAALAGLVIGLLATGARDLASSRRAPLSPDAQADGATPHHAVSSAGGGG